MRASKPKPAIHSAEMLLGDRLFLRLDPIDRLIVIDAANLLANRRNHAERIAGCANRQRHPLRPGPRQLRVWQIDHRAHFTIEHELAHISYHADDGVPWPFAIADLDTNALTERALIREEAARRLTAD